MMYGFSVYSPEGKQPVVLPPAQKGKQRSFAHVTLRGQLREFINGSVLDAYKNLDSTNGE